MTPERLFADDLIDFLYESPGQFQTVRNIKAALLRGGFKQLNKNLNWNIKRGEKYFVTKNDSALVAFITGSDDLIDNGFKIIAAHTDSPALKLKPKALLKKRNNYLQINVEAYGSPILNTWLDRPLSLAGRVVLKSSNPLKPSTKFINIKKPIAIIPNIAIHLDKKANTNKPYSKQNEMQAILQTVQGNLETENYLLKLLAKYARTQIENILDFDLILYEASKGQIIGEQNEFISAGRIDNLAMVHAGVGALLNSQLSKSTNVMVCFDNEEIGSSTKQGASSPFVKDILQRIAWALEPDYKDAFLRAKTNSFGISADMAHALHPNYPTVHDPMLQPQLNQGPIIKYSANQKYVTDAISASVFKALCKNANVPYQEYANHSDIPGGSTLGKILSSQLDIRMVDVGNPMLAMHSIRELSGVKDHYYMKKVFEEFYKY